MIKKKILYICPEVPFPQETGGQVAFNNHLCSLTDHYIVDAVFLDVEGGRGKIPNDVAKSLNHHKIFKRRFPRGNGFLGLLTAIYLFIRYKYPRAYSVRINKKAKDFINERMASYDAVICDHFTAFAILKHNLNLKKIYIAHNIEANVLLDQFKTEKNFIKRLFYFVEYYRTKSIENKILMGSNQILTISLSDFNILKLRNYTRHLHNVAEVLPINAKRWTYSDNKIITFLGGTNYFPNYDAVKWIVEKLYPILKKEENITVQIIGKSSNILIDNPMYIDNINIKFLGFVPDEDLDDLLLRSSIFISPIIFGSGIKIKVLKAISMGIPVFCTKESLYGLEYLEDQHSLVFNRINVEETADKLIKLLRNKNELEKLSTYIVNQSIHQRYDTEALWQTIIDTL